MQHALKSLLIYPKDKIPPNLCKDIIYHWICLEGTCNSSYIGESSRYLEKRIGLRKHNTSTTSSIYQYNFYPQPSPKQIFHILKSLTQDNKQVSREA